MACRWLTLHCVETRAALQRVSPTCSGYRRQPRHLPRSCQLYRGRRDLRSTRISSISTARFFPITSRCSLIRGGSLMNCCAGRPILTGPCDAVAESSRLRQPPRNDDLRAASAPGRPGDVRAAAAYRDGSATVTAISFQAAPRSRIAVYACTMVSDMSSTAALAAAVSPASSAAVRAAAPDS